MGGPNKNKNNWQIFHLETDIILEIILHPEQLSKLVFAAFLEMVWEDLLGGPRFKNKNWHIFHLDREIKLTPTFGLNTK